MASIYIIASIYTIASIYNNEKWRITQKDPFMRMSFCRRFSTLFMHAPFEAGGVCVTPRASCWCTPSARRQTPPSSPPSC